MHESFMYRCLELAKQGAGYVTPNPMVGAVLVHKEKIIGEGYHQQYGQAHAEVNCIRSVREEDLYLIPQSTLYVSLEPCAHYGKTPPCADLIIQQKIPKVVIACRDPFKQVDGKGIEKLQAAGIEVIFGMLEKEAKKLNIRFFTFHTKHRPYIILKWAQTADKKIAPQISGTPNTPPSEGEARLLISNEYTNRLVHKWRSEEASILVGTNTALLDDPELTTRSWPGPSPIRLVVDMNLRLPKDLKLFNEKAPTIIFNTKKHDIENFSPSPSGMAGVGLYQVTEDVNLVHQIVYALYQMKIQSVLVEGGAKLLQSFIDENLWDEIRKIENEELRIENGLAAPVFTGEKKILEEKLLTDKIEIFIND